jgi:ribosome-associated toxin RatA of RatAB toxin-antitoxin module
VLFGVAPAAPAGAEELASLLARGPVALVETRADGHVDRVTALAHIDAPPDRVWSTIVDFGSYVAWMPQVEGSTVTSQTDHTTVVDWSIATPGPNVTFTASYALDPVNRTVAGTWVAGALEGSHWDWQLVPDGSGTLVYRTCFSSAVSDNWLLKQFDDSAHTLELGLNAATPIVELKALQQALER